MAHLGFGQRKKRGQGRCGEPYRQRDRVNEKKKDRGGCVTQEDRETGRD